MKQIFYFIAFAIAASLWSCNTDDNDYESMWEEYADWRADNEEWLLEQAGLIDPDNPGQLFYKKVSPAWDPEAYVLIHYFNDRTLTEGNLSPMFTSTFSASYIGRLYNDVPFDSSFNNPGGVFTSSCSDVITGWAIALENMRVGDTCQILVPYQQGYGWKQMGKIKPFSALRFNMKLYDVPNYETKPL